MSIDTSELQNELRSFGEEVTREQIRKKPDIYIKKLNHYKAKQKQPPPAAAVGPAVKNRSPGRARDAQADSVRQSSDSMIIDELRSFGETIDLKSFAQKRETYIKKLNHLRARQRMADPNAGRHAGASLNESNEDDECEYDDDDDNEDDDEEEENLEEEEEEEEKRNREEKYKNDSRFASSRADDGHNIVNSSRNSYHLNSSAHPACDSSADYTYREVASAGVNTSGVWSPNNSSRWTPPPDSASFNNSQNGSYLSKDRSGLSFTTGNREPIRSSTPSVSPAWYRGSVGGDAKSVQFVDRRNDRDTIDSATTTQGPGWFGSRESQINTTRRQAKPDSVQDDHGKSGVKWLRVDGAWLYLTPVLMIVVAAGLYFFVNSNAPAGLGYAAGFNFLSCDAEDKTEAADENSLGCLSSWQVDEMKLVIHELLGLLSKRAGDFDCGLQTDSRSMSVHEVITKLKHSNVNYQLSLSRCKQNCATSLSWQHFSTVLIVLSRNPSWKIRQLNDAGEDVSDISAVTRLESLTPNLTLVCRITNALDRLFTKIAFVVLGVAFAVVIAVAVGLYWQRRLAQDSEVQRFVENIISSLQSHAAECRLLSGKINYIPIPHLRDSLIPLKDRARKQYLWQRAVRFLSANESRVREEIHLVDGEQTSCWKWIDRSA